MNLKRKEVYVTILVILLVFSSIIIYSLNNENENKLKITVDKTHENLNVVYRENLVEKTDLTDKYYENKTCTSVTTVNENYTLEFNVEMFMSSITGIGNYQTKIFLNAKGKFSSELKPDEIRLRAKGIEAEKIDQNNLDFITSYNEAYNASFVGWDSSEKIRKGAIGDHEAFITFDVKKGTFNISTMVEIVIDESNIGNEYSYRFQSVAYYQSQGVTSTVNLTFLER